MKIYKKICFILLLFSTFFILNGCVKNEYNEFKVQFNNIYSEISKSVDTTDTKKTLQDIKSNENKNRIEQIRVLLEGIQDEVPETKKEEYDVYYGWYRGLVLLRDTSYSEWDMFSFEQKSNVWIEIGVLNVSKE